MSMPRASNCSREWFPPATFQMRLRGLKGISYKVDSATCSKDGLIAVTLQMSCRHDPFWISPAIKWQGEETLSWTDLSFPNDVVPSGLKGVVLRLFYNPPGQVVDNFQFTAKANFFAIGIHFSGLSCVGVHNPRLGHVPKDLVQSNLLFFISGSYFTLPPSKDEDLRSADLVRHCSFGPFEANQTVSSYDPSLLSRFLRIQRAIRQQNIANLTLKTSLLKMGADPDRADLVVTNNAQVSLRQQVFSNRRKDPLTRIKETRIKDKLEALRLKVEFIRDEKKKRKAELEESMDEVASIRGFIEDKTSSLMHSFHSFSKEKASFESWNEDFVASRNAQFDAGNQLQCAQIHMLSNFKEFYPIQISQNSPPTIRWVTMPSVDESRSNSRQEIMMSVTAGWVAELTKIFSSILDLPLRYPIRSCGSFSCIQDNLRFAAEKEFEFPLYTGKFDVAKVEYAIYLLNKNLGQIRWGCGFTTVDLRKTLYNLHEIMSITYPSSDRGGGGKGLIQIRSLSPPPNSQTLASVAAGTASVTPGGHSRNHSQQRHKRGGSLSPVKLLPNSHTSRTSAASDGKEREKKADEPKKSFDTKKVVSQRKPVIPSTKSMSGKSKEPSVRHVQEESPQPSPPSASNMFWGDVTNRTKALSIPTSFQKRQKQKPIDS